SAGDFMAVFGARAGDGQSETVSGWAFSSSAANQTPVESTPIADLSSAAHTPISYSVSGHFSDPDGDPLTFSATLQNQSPLPNWLSINPITGVITGTPPESAAGNSFPIQVTATDINNASTSGGFQLNVTPDLSNPTGPELTISQTGYPASVAKASDGSSVVVWGNTIDDHFPLSTPGVP